MSDNDAEKRKKNKLDESNFDEFETMNIGMSTPRKSKIVTRDVEKTSPAIEKATYTAKKSENNKHSKKTDKTKKAETKKAEPKKLTAKEYKENEIKKAIKNASKLPSTDATTSKFKGFGWKRAVLATVCAVTVLLSIAYVINLTSTDMSLKVAAMQSGIEASYPSYIPRGYTLSDVSSESGKVSMNFKSEDGAFGISEESSNWDSSALLNNYIKDTYGNDYTVVREQGLTLYMGGDWEAWVNGGIVYKLSITSGSLTKKQMKSIATSL